MTRRAARRAAIAAAVSAAALAGAHFNTYEFHLARVIDSDTYRGAVVLWPGQTLMIDVRVGGVDTPETFQPNPQCRDHERTLAKRATDLVRLQLEAAKRILITQPFPGKYGGRVVADVLLEDGDGKRTAIKEILLSSGLAYAYDGGTKKGWCDVMRNEGSH